MVNQTQIFTVTLRSKLFLQACLKQSASLRFILNSSCNACIIFTIYILPCTLLFSQEQLAIMTLRPFHLCTQATENLRACEIAWTCTVEHMGCWRGPFTECALRNQRKLFISCLKAWRWVWWQLGHYSTGVMLNPPKTWHSSKVKQCPGREYILVSRRMFHFLQCLYNALCNALSVWNPTESATTSPWFLQKLVQAVHCHCPMYQGHILILSVFVKCQKS